MDHTRPELRYVNGKHLKDVPIAFDGMDVDSHAGEKLGTVDGFVVDVEMARPLYLVVNADWLTSRLFLISVNQVRFDPQSRALVADLTRDRVSRFPGFDRDEFDELSDDELMAADDQMLVVGAGGKPSSDLAALRNHRRSTYRDPDWWDASYYQPDEAERAGGLERPAPLGKERATHSASVARQDRAKASEMSGKQVTLPAGRRAQPGDVLGIETAGEQTHVGETVQDEKKRRDEAERDAAKQQTH